MAQALADGGGLMIHYSTDYVFDGAKAEAYTEEDIPIRSTYTAEASSGASRPLPRAAALYHPAYLLGVRHARQQLPAASVRLAREKHELRMVEDQYGAPTWARTIAEATAAIVARAGDLPGEPNRQTNRHLQSDCCGRTTWAGFATTILDDV